MSRVDPTLRIFCLLLLAAISVVPLAAQDEPLRIETDLVTVPVTVLDRSGRYISNLTGKDFKVYEDGNEQEIASVWSTDSEVTVLLLLDCSGSMRPYIPVIAKAASTFVRQLRPNDSLIVASFGEKVEVILPETKIKDFQVTMKLREQPGDFTRIHDAMDFGMRKLGPVRGRKAIVLFTDGESQDDRMSAKKNLYDASEQESLIYTVRFGNGGDVRPVGSLNGDGSMFPDMKKIKKERQEIADYMSGLADSTGGRAFRIEEIADLDQIFGEITAELTRQYVLGYYPNAPGRDGERRKITVKVNIPDVAVRSRAEVVYHKPKN